MSYLDYAFIGIILISGLIALNRGLILTVFSFCSLIVSIVLSYLFYPTISNFLMNNTGLFDTIKLKIMNSLELENVAQSVVDRQGQIEMINGLQVPPILKNMLISNNNPEVYNLLEAGGIAEYIGGLLATVVINAISFIILFIGISIVLKIFAGVLDLITKLPVIHQLNKMGGLILGSMLGILIVWIVCVGMSVIIGVQGDSELLQIIDSSPVVSFFYENNLLIWFITDMSKTLTL